MTRKLTQSVLLLAVIGVLSSCDDGPTDPATFVLQLAPQEFTLNALGDTLKLAVELRRSGLRLDPADVTLQVLDPGIVELTPNKDVIARAPGTARIVGSAHGVSDTARVIVRQDIAQLRLARPGASDGSLDNDSIFALGDTLRLIAIAEDRNGYPIANQQVQWLSLNPSVAVVSNQGLVTSVSNGASTIRVSGAGVVDSVRIGVRQVVSRVDVTLAEHTFNAIGHSRSAPFQALDSRGSAVAGVAATWSSSNAAVASVDQSGTFTARSTGTAYIRATGAGMTDSLRLTVRQIAAEIRLTPTTMSLVAYAAGTFTAAAYDSNSVAIPGAQITWSTTNSSVANVQSGVVTAVAAGSTNVIASVGTVAGAALVTVAPPPVTTIVITPTNATMRVGETSQLLAAVFDAGNNVLNGRTITWASSNSGVASVNTVGVVTANGVGTATVTASSEGRVAAATITVEAATTPPPPPPPPPGGAVASVTVTPGSATLNVGAAVTLTATLRDATNNILTGRTVTWTSGNTAVATVTATGVATAVGAGSATITASSEGRSGTASITVNAVTTPVASVTVIPGSVSLGVGSTQQMSATTYSSTGAVLAGRTVTWSSSSPGVATVSSTGFLTAVSLGTTTITATSEGRSGTSAITVVAAAPPPPPPPAGVIFQSNFSALLGNSDAAQSDGGKWEHLVCPATSRRNVLEVVPGSQAGWTLTPNILRINNTGNPTGSDCGMVQTRLNVPLGNDFYIRMYIRVENEDDFNFHAVNLHYGAMEALPWSIFDPVASVDYNPKFTIETPSGNQFRRWKPTQKLRQGQWYRFEWHVQYVNVQAHTARIWPRIYDMQGNLLYDASTHIGIDQSQITLQQFYDQGGVAHFDDLDAARHFAFGYEGRTQQQDQTRHWYHAAVEIRTDTWPGPIR